MALNTSVPIRETRFDGSIVRSELRKEPENSWYAVWTRSRHEQMVCRALAAKQVETFLPTVVQISKWKDRTKRIAWPLFPGYCFARIDCSDLLKVLRCEGVVSVLCNGSKPVSIPRSEIEALQCLVNSGLNYDPCSEILAGSMVRVVTGPLSGISGRVVRKGPQEHLILAVDLLNSGARIQVAAWDIEPL